MIVVADASPLIALARIEQLGILASLYDYVVIPPTVLAEIERRPPWIGESHPSWLQVRPVHDRAAVEALSNTLDAGEAEAIILAKQLAVPLLIDERIGRRVAASLGLQLTGTVGLLLQAKREGLIEWIGPLLDQLQAARFHLSPSVMAEVRRAAGE